MGKIVSLTMPDGSVAQASELDFKMKGEPWTVLEVEDGTEVRVRPDIGKMYRLEGRFDPVNGEPIYYFTSSNLIRTNVPLALRVKGKVALSDPQGLYR